MYVSPPCMYRPCRSALNYAMNENRHTETLGDCHRISCCSVVCLYSCFNFRNYACYFFLRFTMFGSPRSVQYCTSDDCPLFDSATVRTPATFGVSNAERNGEVCEVHSAKVEGCGIVRASRRTHHSNPGQLKSTRMMPFFCICLWHCR